MFWLYSECFMLTVRVFTLKLLSSRLFALNIYIYIYITLLMCVGLLTPTLHCFSLYSLAPDKAPTILSVTPHTTTSVLVRWQVRCCVTLWTFGWIHVCKVSGIEQMVSLCSPPLRITSTESCWGSGSGTGSYTTTGYAASLSAKLTAPLPTGPISLVSFPFHCLPINYVWL